MSTEGNVRELGTSPRKCRDEGFNIPTEPHKTFLFCKVLFTYLRLLLDNLTLKWPKFNVRECTCMYSFRTHLMIIIIMKLSPIVGRCALNILIVLGRSIVIMHFRSFSPVMRIVIYGEHFRAFLLLK